MIAGDDAPARLGPINAIQIDRALSDETRLAIAAADHLIVICSPHTATSPHLNAAAEVFTRKLRSRAIIPVVVAGEPGATRLDGLAHTECLPPALRFAVDASGAVTPHPLNITTIDARPGHYARAEDITTQIASRMLGAPLIGLRAHDQRRRKRSGFMIGAGIAAGLAAVAALPVVMNDMEQTRLAADARQAGLAAHAALDRGDAAAARAALIPVFAPDTGASAPMSAPQEAISALTRTAIEVRRSAQIAAPVGNIHRLSPLPQGALAAIGPDGDAHLIDLGAGEAIGVYRPKGGATTRISPDGGTLWSARFGPLQMNEAGEAYAPLMFEDVALATGDVTLKTAVQAVPATGEAVISPDGALFAIDAGPGDGDRAMIAVFRRDEQSLAGVTTLPSDKVGLKFVDAQRLLLSINPPSPFGAAPGLYLWDLTTGGRTMLRRPGAAPVCPGARGLPHAAIIGELTAGRLAPASWVAGPTGTAMLLPRVTGGSCLLRWSAAGDPLRTLVFHDSYESVVYGGRNLFALTRRDGDTALIGGSGGVIATLTGCRGQAQFFNMDAAPVVFCNDGREVAIHNGLSGQRYWRAASPGPLTTVAHDPAMNRIIGADDQGGLHIWDAAARGWAVDHAAHGATLARAGVGHVAALSDDHAPKFYDLDGQRSDGVSRALRARLSEGAESPVLALGAQLGAQLGAGPRAACADMPPSGAIQTALSPSGARMAVEDASGVSVYDLATCAPLLRLRARTTGGGPLLPSEDRLWLPLPGELAIFPLSLDRGSALTALRAP